MTPHSIKAKHVSYLLQRWQQEDLKVGTLKNRMSAIRWWLQKVTERPPAKAGGFARGAED